MNTADLTAQDIREITAHGLTPETVRGQMATIAAGLPYARLLRPCTSGDGIVTISSPESERLRRIFQDAALAGRFTKFVPASGAASRMFQALHAVRARYDCNRVLTDEDAPTDDPDLDDLRHFARGLDRLPFFEQLDAALATHGPGLRQRARQGRWGDILTGLLTSEGLDYASRPKGLIPFHRYPDRSRTPVQEHLVEAAATVRDRQGCCRVHFTVSAAHQAAFAASIDRERPRYTAQETRLEIGISTQRPSTDTIALDDRGRLFRGPDGRPLFRPGGHGALLANLDELGADLVFVKNIDNVVPDRLKPENHRWMETLGGLLVELQQQVQGWLERMAAGTPDAAWLADLEREAGGRLGIGRPENRSAATFEQRVAFWRDALNRPIRVCGMTPNVGAPGGGPFWVSGADGRPCRQIVESAHVDMQAAGQSAVWQAATHFNPVNLVCGLRDWRRQPFDLPRFADPQAGFIVRKSLDGKTLTGLEHPGLWNGAMADWITVFVEMPLATFNPVKTVLSLLEPAHQA